MLVKDFIHEFIEVFNKKVVGKVAVPGGQTKLLSMACTYPLVGTGFHISEGNITASIDDLEGETVEVLMFTVNIKYNYHPLSQCSLVGSIELKPTKAVEHFIGYEDLPTKTLIDLVKTDILRGNNTL